MITSSKLPHTGTTIFTIMSALAQESGAINLGQGFPGFDIDAELPRLVQKWMGKGMNQYAPMPGVQPLRQQIALKMQRNYGRAWDPESDITITAGATQAIFTAITAFVHPGDEVILFSPAYDCYEPAVQLNGGIPVWIRLEYPDYRIPWEEVATRINERTRMIVINTPHNPTGSILTEQDLIRLGELVQGTNIIVLSDEVYEHIVFDGATQVSCAARPELSDRSIIVYSFGKTYHATGWKLGYAIAAPGLMKEFRKVHQFNVFSCNTPIQYALAEYMENIGYTDGIAPFYQKLRDRFLSGLKDSAFTWKPADGTYFQLLSYSGFRKESDIEVAKEWTRSPGIASIPVSSFYPDGFDNKVLRFCFAKSEEVLDKATHLLRNIG